MPFYPQDIIITPNLPGTVYSASTSEGGALSGVPTWLKVQYTVQYNALMEITGYSWAFSVTEGASPPVPSSVVLTKQNTQSTGGTTDTLYVWLSATTNTLTPVNPLVPLGLDTANPANPMIQFASSSSTAAWSVAGGQAGGAVTNNKGSFTIKTTEGQAYLKSSGPSYDGSTAYAIICDGSSYSRLWFLPYGPQAGSPSNVLSYTMDNGIMYFSYVPDGGGTPVVVNYGIVDPGSVPRPNSKSCVWG